MAFDISSFANNTVSSPSLQALTGGYTAESSVGGLQSAYSGFDSLVSSVLESSNSSSSMSFGSISSGSVSGMDTKSLVSYLNGASSGVSDYLGSSNQNLPSAQGLKDAFAGLNEKSTVADYTTAWMKANYPNMTDAEIAAVNEQYAPFTQQMEQAYKNAETQVSNTVKTDANGNPDINSYYMSFLNANYPDMSAEEKKALCAQYSAQYDQTMAQYKQAAESTGLKENATINDYYTAMLKKMNPGLSDSEVKELAAAYEKSSAPVVKYYTDLKAAMSEEGHQQQ